MQMVTKVFVVYAKQPIKAFTDKKLADSLAHKYPQAKVETVQLAIDSLQVTLDNIGNKSYYQIIKNRKQAV